MKKTVLSALLVIMLLACLYPTFVLAETSSLQATEDVYRITWGSSTSNTTEIEVGSTTQAMECKIYLVNGALKFDLGSIEGNITGAKLKFHVTFVGKYGLERLLPSFNLIKSNDDSWTEDNRHMPSFNEGDIINSYSCISVSEEGEKTFDVTDYVIEQYKNDSSKLVTFVLQGAEKNGACFRIASSESTSNRPILEITYEDIKEPEMHIKGKAVEIADGDNSPSKNDDTDFGNANVSDGKVSKTFTIENKGNVDLTFTENPIVAISGDGDFSVISQPTTPIAAGSSTEFTIEFDPVTVGTKTATVSIVNNDSDENPYNFDVQGEGVPEILISDATETEGNNVSFTVSLSEASSKIVSVDYNTADDSAKVGSDYVQNVGTISFNPGETTKNLNIELKEDTLDEENETFKLCLANPSNATIKNTEGIGTITDNDEAPTVSLGITDSNLDEDGGTATINANLSTPSAKDITVFLDITGTATKGKDYTVTSEEITINAADTNGIITLTATNDFIAEDDETILVDISSVTNGTKNGMQQVSATITDDDTAKYVVTETDGKTLVTETETTDTFNIVLGSQPVSNVVFNISSGDVTEAKIDKATVTFTNENWNIPQTVTVTGQDDKLIDNTQTCDITVSVDDLNSDDKFDALDDKKINVTITDNDVAGYKINETDGDTQVSEEGTTDQFSIVLEAQPSLDVVFNLSSKDTSEVTVSPILVTFTNENWNIPQTVTVTGVDDFIKDNNQTSKILISVKEDSSDDNFDLLSEQQVNVVTIDNEVPGITINETDLNTQVVETGTKDTFTIRLNTQPISDVVLDINSEDIGEVTADISTATFTSTNWNVPQIVTVTGVDDLVEDGEQTTNVVISVNEPKSDDSYDGINKIVIVKTKDNDCPEINIKGNNQDILNGDAKPRLEDNTDFGSVDITGQTKIKTYVIENTGIVDLALTGIPRVEISGKNVNDFIVVSQPASKITPNEVKSFDIKFDPSEVGEKIAEVCIKNNDSNENTYRFTIKGTGTSDIQAPISTEFTPKKGEENLDVDSNLEMKFDEDIVGGRGNITIFKASNDTIIETISAGSLKVEVSGNKVVINPEKVLENGTKYYINVEKGVFEDKVGNQYDGIKDKDTWSFTTKTKRSSGGSSKGSFGSSETKTKIEVEVNGKKQNKLGEIQKEINNGQTLLKVKINKKELEEKLKVEGKKAKITIPVKSEKGTVVGELDGQMIKTMEEKEAIVEIKTEKASYTLPAKQIKIEEVSKKLGKKIELKDIKVKVEVAETSKEMVKVVEDVAKKDNFTLVVPPVDFKVECINGDKKVEVKSFNTYVERTIAIPKDVDPKKITTGLIMYEDGATCHVPTKVIVIDGKYYAKINSLTNSTYEIIWNPRKYKDVENHWGKAVCNEMGARKIVKEVKEDTFSPNIKVSRLFFTETLVRALGLGEKGTEYKFTDVDKSKPYFGAVATGIEYKLVSGYEDNTFRATNDVTREEAAALIVRTMKIAGLKVDYTKEELDKELDKFKDKEDIGKWARQSVAICVKNGMIVGYENENFMPKEKMTRAQLAAIMERMLKKAELI